MFYKLNPDAKNRLYKIKIAPRGYWRYKHLLDVQRRDIERLNTENEELLQALKVMVKKFADAKRETVRTLYEAGVVSVVRCKDCRYYRLSHLACVHPNFNGIIGIDGFCSYGERKS